MTLSTPPNQPQPLPLPQPAPALTLKQRLMREARYLDGLPRRRFALLFLVIGLFAFLSPPLPVVAYSLWLWASSSSAWRDRWGSLGALARRGGLFVGVVLAWAALSLAQIWFFPDVTAALQAFWRGHLPGELSLMPLFSPSLLARTVLLLPLAPALARYFEQVAPRTQEEQRILKPHDLEPKKPKTRPKPSTTAQRSGPPGSEQTAKPKPKPKPTAKAAPQEPIQQHSEKQNPASPPEQITIDSDLAPMTGQAQANPAPSSEPPAKKQPEPTPKTQAPATAPDPFKRHIDWNDVAE